ncbi:hypothetical protein BJV78DRAFT_701174 [Lactifluus subvellereus]|nr:hypothetical protein BJV78DRAFT_701174 [Lactifluus subvellereus]
MTCGHPLSLPSGSPFCLAKSHVEGSAQSRGFIRGTGTIPGKTNKRRKVLLPLSAVRIEHPVPMILDRSIFLLNPDSLGGGAGGASYPEQGAYQATRVRGRASPIVLLKTSNDANAAHPRSLVITAPSPAPDPSSQPTWATIMVIGPVGKAEATSNISALYARPRRG